MPANRTQSLWGEIIAQDIRQIRDAILVAQSAPACGKTYSSRRRTARGIRLRFAHPQMDLLLEVEERRAAPIREGRFFRYRQRRFSHCYTPSGTNYLPRPSINCPLATGKSRRFSRRRHQTQKTIRPLPSYQKLEGGPAARNAKTEERPRAVSLREKELVTSQVGLSETHIRTNITHDRA